MKIPQKLNYPVRILRQVFLVTATFIVVVFFLVIRLINYNHSQTKVVLTLEESLKNEVKNCNLCQGKI